MFVTAMPESWDGINGSSQMTVYSGWRVGPGIGVEVSRG
jgi:hypothetical protein